MAHLNGSLKPLPGVRRIPVPNVLAPETRGASQPMPKQVKLDNLGMQVLEHWKKHLPRRCARLEQDGRLEKEVQAAADALHLQCLKAHRTGDLTYEEAFQSLREERAFPPETEDDRQPRDLESGQFLPFESGPTEG